MTISLRVWLPVAIISLLLLAFGSTMYFAFNQQIQYRKIENRYSEIYRLSNRLLSQLKDAETGQRGYVLTGEDRYLQPFISALTIIPDTLTSLHNYAADDPVLNDQLLRLDPIVKDKLAELEETIKLRHDTGFDAAVAVIRTGRGQKLMEDARAMNQEIGDAEKKLLATTIAEEEAFQRTLWRLLVIGGPVIFLLALFSIGLATRRIVRSVRGLEAGVASIGSSVRPICIEIPGNDEFSRLASSFNGMSARLGSARIAQDRAESQLRENNENLVTRGHELEERTHVLDLLGRVAHRLPGCSNEEEFSALIERYIPQLFSNIPGALYLLNPSHTLLRCVAQWNSPKAGAPEFRPDDCWAMRRGQAHINLDFGKEVICPHINTNATDAYMCWPLTAQNETVGLLYLEHVQGAPFVLQNRKQDISVLSETIALALVNLRLRESLRNQSIRDPLTGLFNRRYLEESLELEFSRAERSKSPVAIVMVDLDHFKRLNDTFGHGAGDLVLKQVGVTLEGCIRKGDVACRYGGEEFLLVLIGASPEGARLRAEQVRTALKELIIDYNGNSLGTITASFGVAVYPVHGATPATVIAAADAALYQAKRAGRDRVFEAEFRDATIAAE